MQKLKFGHRPEIQHFFFKYVFLFNPTLCERSFPLFLGMLLYDNELEIMDNNILSKFKR